jgi:hypothetical protein
MPNCERANYSNGIRCPACVLYRIVLFFSSLLLIGGPGVFSLLYFYSMCEKKPWPWTHYEKKILLT